MVASICGKIVCATLFALAIPTASAGSAQAANPSFDCGKARRPDEQTICKDSRLGELDQAVTLGFAQAAQEFKEEARKIAVESLAAPRQTSPPLRPDIVFATHRHETSWMRALMPGRAENFEDEMESEP